ncbi:MAG: flagellar biosynthetic protein FliR [Planctomycetota bacterium]|nr:flagellar biosynthetic protein FliR [Planctomycetota bacterium]
MGESILSIFLAQSLAAWLLAFARLLPLACCTPMPGAGVMAWPFRLAAAGLLALALAPYAASGHFQTAQSFLASLVLELLVGGVLALSVACIVSAVRSSLSIVEVQPAGTQAEGPLGRLYGAALLAALGASGGLHLVLGALLRTYVVFPVSSGWPRAAAAGLEPAAVIQQLSGFFSLSLLLALPILAAAFILDVVIALLGRVVPAGGSIGAFGSIVRSLAIVAAAATTMLALLSVAMGRLAQI